jgi:pilus assembly protein CpaC
MMRTALFRLALLLGAATLNVPATVMAAEASPVASNISLDAGTGRVVTLPSAAANVFVADSKVAEVRPASATTLFVFGVASGRTTVAALDAAGGLLAQFEVTVQPSNFGAAQAQAEIARLVARSHVSVRSLPTGMMLTGSVESPADAAQAVAVAKAFSVEKQPVENQLSVRSSVQITLQVRIAEMSRTLSRKLGVNWSSVGNIGQIGVVKAVAATLNGGVFSGGQTSFPNNGGLNLGVSAVLDALASEGVVRLLAEPNLTVISGQPASFLVGGQFPIPVPGGAAGQVTIDYKSYGVSLSFLPTMFSDGRISIHVAPEVSQISNQNAVTVTTSGSSIVVPSLTVRRAETTVELGSGQTFAIAGLLQDAVTGNRNMLPYLADVPILGPAFRDDQFQRGETEIVILVTPYVVNPVNDPSALKIPGSGPVTSDLDRLLFMKSSTGSGQRTLAATPGVAGFIVQ